MTDIPLTSLLGRSLNDVELKFAPERIFCNGPMKIPLPHRKISIIGSRMASEQGLLDAKKISKILTENNIIIVSGLAKGIDTAAHQTAIKCRGSTIAVIGTPLNKIYPKENSTLQEEIAKNHLLVSQYPPDHITTPKDFVLRNKTMALISDATVIIEAKDSSGTLSHGYETLRLGRPLFFCKSIKHDKLTWPQKMTQYGAIELDEPLDILEHLPDII